MTEKPPGHTVGCTIKRYVLSKCAIFDPTKDDCQYYSGLTHSQVHSQSRPRSMASQPHLKLANTNKRNIKRG